MSGGTVRVLNIVVEECTTLASRDRCPFLVHLEVAETGLNGNDSRLFASGAPGLGATVEEALSMSAAATSAASAIRGHTREYGQTPYQIPPELLVPHSSGNRAHDYAELNEENEVQRVQNSDHLRGGSQSNKTSYYSSHPDPDDVLTSIPYDEFRQNQYEQLHHQMYSDERKMDAPVSGPAQG